MITSRITTTARISIMFILVVAVFILLSSILGEYGIILGWGHLQTPEGKILDLFLGKNGEVFLSLENGRLYEWDRNRDAWKITDKPSNIGPYGGNCVEDNNSSGVRRPPLINWKKRINGICLFADGSSSYNLILDNENQVWIWTGGYGLFGEASILFRALLIIIILGISLFILPVKRYKQ